jgi:hypothetical protein
MFGAYRASCWYAVLTILCVLETNAVRRLSPTQPRLLLCQIHLKRFRFSRTYREKLGSLVRFPLEGLDLRDFEACTTDATDPAIYDLVAISVCTDGTLLSASPGLYYLLFADCTIYSMISESYGQSHRWSLHRLRQELHRFTLVPIQRYLDGARIR